MKSLCVAGAEEVSVSRPVDHSGGVSSVLSGTAHEVVQARDISGGVHFHASASQRPPVPRQLPADVYGFVGRTGELDALHSLLEEGPSPGPRLIVVAGTPGAGKTSLAVRFAYRVRARFPDGQLFVNLRGYDPGPPLAPGTALERFLRALGIAASVIPEQVEERAELYRSLLAERRVLVVLDNAATVGQVRPLLPGEPGCLVLVTSRGRLSALSAREGARRITLGLLAEPEAIDLIREVTGEYRSGDDPGQVAQLSRLCGRLPLALRIAAERAAARPLMPLSELIDQLRGQSSLWDALSLQDEQDAEAVRTVFAWSYRTLPKTAARAFRLLGLHPGPDFGPGAAAALLRQSPQEARDLLDALAGAHLLEQTGPARYQFHDLLRAYAADLAGDQDDEQQRRAALARLAEWYLHSADAASCAAQTTYPSVLHTGPDPDVEPMTFSGRQEAVDWYHAERANLLALALASAVAGLDEAVWQLAATTAALGDMHGATDDGLELGRLGLEAARRLGDQRAEAAMLQLLGYRHADLGRREAADFHHAALDAYAALADSAGMIEAANGIGVVHLRRRDLDPAATWFTRALEQAHIHGNRTWAALALNNLAYTRLEQGLLEPALDMAAQALRAHQEAGTGGAPHLEALFTAIRAHREHGDLSAAEHHLHAAEQFIAAGERHLGVELDILLERAALALTRGEPETALDLYWRCEQLQRPLGDRSREASLLSGAGNAFAALGRTKEAADFHRRAVVLRRMLPDACRLADALSRLADTLTARGETREAGQVRAEADALLVSFTDPRAAALRDLLATHPATA